MCISILALAVAQQNYCISIDGKVALQSLLLSYPMGSLDPQETYIQINDSSNTTIARLYITKNRARLIFDNLDINTSSFIYNIASDLIFKMDYVSTEFPDFKHTIEIIKQSSVISKETM